MTRRFRFDQLALVFILLIAFFFRVWHLGLKPPHFDEGINGRFVDQMWQDGFYRYDPRHFHGPLYFYVLQFAELAFGPSLVAFRFATGLISVGVVAVVAAHRRFFGRAALWAALLIALSPGFVFFSRYAIHESLFILFQVIFSYGFFEFFETAGRERRSALANIACGFFGTLMVKETLVIFFVTWAIAYVCAIFSQRLYPAKEPLASKSSDDVWWPEAVTLFSLGAFVTMTVFSGFFLNPQGIKDLFVAFMFWTQTGTGVTGHGNPFNYWWMLFSRYEWSLVAGVVLAPVAFFVSDSRIRLIAFFSFGTWLAYSIVPYKTPWLILNILWPAALIVGLGIEIAIVQLRNPQQSSDRFAAAAVLLALTAAFGHSTFKMITLNFRDYDNPAEPYVYVQTTQQYQTVMDVIDENLRQRPEYLTMRVAALNRDPWPLPFSLGRFPNLQWGSVGGARLDGIDIVLIDAVAKPDLENKINGKFWVMPFKIRDAYEEGWAYLNYDKFNGVVPPTTPIFEKRAVTP